LRILQRIHLRSEARSRGGIVLVVNRDGYIKRLKEYANAYEQTSLSRENAALSEYADKAAVQLARVKEELLVAEQADESTNWNQRREQFERVLADTGERPEEDLDQNRRTED
jgi:hypothetical protein